MKKLEYYLKNEKELLERRITEDLKKGPVQLSVDCTIESVKDMDKPSVRFSMKRVYKKNAGNLYRIAQKPTIQSVMPRPGSMQNGILLDHERPIPVYAPSTYEPSDYTSNQMILGLFLMLQQERDEYFLTLLKSFDIDKKKMTPDLKMMIKGKYWNGKNKKLQDKEQKNTKGDVGNSGDASKDISES